MEEAKVSYINDIPVKIAKYYDSYFVTFEYRDMVFDITAQMEQEELIDALKSLLKGKGIYYEIETNTNYFTKYIWNWVMYLESGTQYTNFIEPIKKWDLPF